MNVLGAEKKNEGMTRDVGTQSTPDISSSSLSSASTPPIVERSLNRFRGGDSPNSNSNSNSKPKSEEEDGEEEVCCDISVLMLKVKILACV